MDIEEFYDPNRARRNSEEFEFGRDWSDAQGNDVEISWVQTTNQYAIPTDVEAHSFGQARVTNSGLDARCGLMTAKS